ncbi:MAG: transposase [Patescibacteria group bacterium]|nr:transposase [Patescibacteria group bacterium]
MSIQRPLLINNEIYHIIIRGVGDISIFKNEQDYYRAIFSLFEFNNTDPVQIFKRRKEIKSVKKMFKDEFVQVGQGQSLSDFILPLSEFSATFLPDKRDLLVNIFAFCFMPNHIHLLIQQIKDVGITNFMRKLGTGYASYFNKKYDRKGHLFQSRFKAVLVENNEQLKTVFTYINTNPISLIEPGWKDFGIKDSKKTNKFLEKYKWSSYLDYIGKKNFPSVTERDFMLKVMDGEQGCKDYVKNWIKYKKEIRN